MYRPKPKTHSVSSNSNKVVKLPYVEISNASSSQYSLWNQTFRGNGLYDPDYASGGHQPMGFDQYMSLYKKYYVKSATIKARIWSGAVDGNSAHNNDSFVYVWADTDASGASPSTDPKTVAERCLAHDGKVARVGNTYNPDVCVNLKAFTKNETDKGFSSEDTSGGEASDPANVWFIHVVIANPLSTIAKVYQSHVSIVYDVMFYDPKDLGTS